MAERKIGSKTYQVNPILATDAILLQVRLVSAIANSIDRLPIIMAGAGTGASPEAKLASDAASVAAFVEVFGKNDPIVLTQLIKDVVQLAAVKRPSGTWDQVDMDAEFTGNLNDLIPVVIFVLQEQFGSFFTGLLALGSQKQLAKA